MFSEYKSFSYMEVSNSEMFFSEDDLGLMEINFFVRPALEFDQDECDIAPLEDGSTDDDELHNEKDQDHQVQEQEQEEKKEEEDKCKILLSTLEIKLPSLGEFKIGNKQEEEEKEVEDGLKTPTSLDQKIPHMLQCPPAPRKPKSLPSSAKRKSAGRRILLDLSKEIESLFPLTLLGDLGGKIKKVRQENDTK